MNLVIATCSTLVPPHVAAEESLLIAALRERGVEVEQWAWDDRDRDWSSVSMCLFRSTWDAWNRRDEFLGWARTLAKHAIVWNPVELVAWMMHKAYLTELADRGVPIVPAIFFSARSHVELRELVAQSGWNELIIKPSVASTSRGIMRVLALAGDLDAAQAHLDALLLAEDVVVQPYIRSIETRGERGLIFANNALVFAVEKHPAPGDFKIHNKFGGTEKRVVPTEEELSLARAALGAAPKPTLIARVDILYDQDRPLLSEIEWAPRLYLTHAPELAGVLADAIMIRMESSR